MRQIKYNSNGLAHQTFSLTPKASDLEFPTSGLRIPPSFRQSRSGISIIEVMSAVVVAMIGVFGTLVLIPFAVRQAQSGLDLDDGRNLALNSVATFDAMGFDDPTDWVQGFALPDTSASNPVTQGVVTQPNVPVMIDPLWLNANGIDANVGFSAAPTIRNNFGFFGDGVLATDPDGAGALGFSIPSNMNGAPGTLPATYPLFGQVHPALPSALRIRRFSLTNGAEDSRASQLMTPSLARNLFQSTDALNFSKFGTEDGDLARQPFQIFDRGAMGNIIGRQSTGGRLSQAMFIIPGEGQLAGVYRRVTLVFSDRDFTLYENPGGTRPANQAAFDAPNNNVNMRSLMLSALVTTRAATPTGPSGFEGGEVVICPVVWPGGGGGANPTWNSIYLDVEGTPEAPGVRRDDWVMMINLLPAGHAGVSTRRRQVQFYRVANIDEGQGVAGNTVLGTDLPSLTLDGPAFDFGPDGSGALTQINTYIVHLRDVVSVFEDSISL